MFNLRDLCYRLPTYDTISDTRSCVSDSSIGQLMLDHSEAGSGNEFLDVPHITFDIATAHWWISK